MFQTKTVIRKKGSSLLSVMKMEFGKVILGASLIVMALFLAFAPMATTAPDLSWTYVTNDLGKYAGGAVAGILGVAMLLLEYKKIKY